MHVRQARWSGSRPSPADLEALSEVDPHLILVFGPVEVLEDGAALRDLQACSPGAHLLGCSTAGTICQEGVFDLDTVATAVRFREARLRTAWEPLSGMADSREAGLRLGHQLAAPDLSAVLLLGQGVAINGSALIAGLREAVGPGVSLSGALAGDGGRFQRTLTALGPLTSDHHLAALGFYGTGVRATSASAGGWEPFGPIRHITRSQGNLLSELDGEPALDVYKRYLGEWASGLPASGLLFPLALMDPEQETTGLVRTILGVDEAAGHLILAGDVPEGGCVRLMHASTTALVEGARTAATLAAPEGPTVRDRLALLFSCVGRKLVMGGRVDQEVEAVGQALGGSSLPCGFYSYGEIGPTGALQDCRLHNQTMTITLLQDRD